MPQTQIQTRSLHAGRGFVARSLTALTEALARRRDRQHLAHLDAHLLRDIGLDAQEARREAAKPFWQP
ncbi:DUF1127 domain-containing protein [Rhodobacter calidifons]|uniref:DUF1127 domain-containing protein n=1 Tax=Rhodobacter calidifons TaxID=2715277 RepID=A0ABX0G9V2_9RHOB|nr:DUF1127 domain-containing protein [Rhodobacter calidifons]NHB77476.1 DUF1127 domain-containing protein [Rhodobacter calidifons]